ncbi:GNAT family N-acetyltransferase [Aestuariivivens sediminis]|uniref:GNAT family N-acetyltransferase n=1 Tax=Aestuariivivens sediminis TaxID=2913557 RepID=UPI001F57DC9F|nr:GNAT family N-acetyltransferase [Aestuariivivens sediminis]
MKLLFKKNRVPHRFFRILPLDWKNSIVPQWPNYKASSSIYVIECDGQVIAGGIVFSKTPPHATPIELEYNYLFKANYLYIGYLYVLPEFRNKNIASKWLEAVKNRYDKQKFWLTIEVFDLKFFYEKNGFKLMDSSPCLHSDEWVMISE